MAITLLFTLMAGLDTPLTHDTDVFRMAHAHALSSKIIFGTRQADHDARFFPEIRACLD